MTQLPPQVAFLFIRFLPCLDLQQCVNISIWVAQCLGEFVLNKESRGTGQRLSFTSMDGFSGRRDKQNSRNKMCPNFLCSLVAEDSVWILMCNTNTVDIMKMNAATTFKYSWPLAPCWCLVCFWVIYALKTCICAYCLCIYGVHTKLPLHSMPVPPCAYICIYLCWHLAGMVVGSCLHPGSCVLKHGVITIILQAPHHATYPAGRFSTAPVMMSENWGNWPRLMSTVLSWTVRTV